MTHRLMLVLPWQDEHTPVVWPYHTREDADKYQKGDEILLIINGKSYQTKVLEVLGEGAAKEMVLNLA
jgi:hypothetical protein